MINAAHGWIEQSIDMSSTFRSSRLRLWFQPISKIDKKNHEIYISELCFQVINCLHTMLNVKINGKVSRIWNKKKELLCRRAMSFLFFYLMLWYGVESNDSIFASFFKWTILPAFVRQFKWQFMQPNLFIKWFFSLALHSFHFSFSLSFALFQYSVFVVCCSVVLTPSKDNYFECAADKKPELTWLKTIKLYRILIYFMHS